MAITNTLQNSTTSTVTPKKPTVNFPQQQPGQALPLTPTAIQQPQQPTGALAGAGQVFDPNLSQKVQQTAQQKALAGTPQQTAQLVSQQTQGLLQDPSMGRDPEAEKNLALDQLRRRQAESFEQFRQATGGVANTGVNLQDLVSAQLQQRQEMTDTGRQLDIDEQNRRQQEMINALAQGRETAQLEQGLQTGDIQNLLATGEGALGFAELASKQDILLSEQDFAATQKALDDQLKLAIQANDINAQKDILGQQLEFEKKQAELGREFTASQNELNRLLETNLANLDADTQKELVNLKALVDKDMLISQQDFASSEAELQRQFQEAMQNNDFAQANSMAQMLNEFDVLKQQSQQEWQTAENLANNAFQEQLQMNEQDFNKAMQYIQHDLDLAKSEDNFEKQQFLMDKQSDLELQMLTQNFQHDEKMAILNTELQQAIADQDVERQKQLLGFSHGLEMNKIEQEQGFQESMAYVQNQLQQALQNNDFENAKVLNELQYEHQMQMHMDEMAISQAKIDLEQQGLDMAQVESEYNKIQDLIAQEQLDPTDAVEFMALQFEDSLPEGFEFSQPDPFAIQKAMKEDYINQQYQYALSNNIDVTSPTDAEFNQDGDFIGLKGEYLGQFNDYINETLYGQTGTPLEADIIGLKNGDIPLDQIDQKHIDYLLKDISIPQLSPPQGDRPLKDWAHNTWSKGEKGRGADSRTTFTALEDAKFINIGGDIWKVDGQSVHDRIGDDWTNYKLVNAKTGEVLELTAQE